MNRIQNIRKSSNFEITDKIDIVISSNEQTDEAVNEYADYIARQVLAENIAIGNIADNDRIELNMEEYPGLCVSVKLNK